MTQIIDFRSRQAPIPAHDGEVLPPMGAVVDIAKRRERLAKRYGSDFEAQLRQIIREALREVLPDIMRQVLGEMAREAANAKTPRKRSLRLVAPQAGRA